MQSRGYSSYCVYIENDSDTWAREQPRTRTDCEVKQRPTRIHWSGNLVEEHMSEITPIIEAELAAVGRSDDKLVLRIARKIVMKQLGITDLDELM